ncbi:hypothetical protein B0T16DRAFT_416730 [Cercophora newfieldiana]|uniref:Secreted protein n=1 Tax=Cercophora newfieldiana TaxID=92897 RepID=A0AA39Y1T4_9PEZI|nr:hypothetical protein B0T16DRAFT_416730 [Cercophora newfieldiana]
MDDRGLLLFLLLGGYLMVAKSKQEIVVLVHRSAGSWVQVSVSSLLGTQEVVVHLEGRGSLSKLACTEGVVSHRLKCPIGIRLHGGSNSIGVFEVNQRLPETTDLHQSFAEFLLMPDRHLVHRVFR